MKLELDGRHALVCGASKGIGRATATELAALGADVTVLARSEDVLRALVDTLPRTHDAQQHRFLVADMSDRPALAAAIEAHIAAHPAQILIHNSGGPPAGPAHRADAAAFEQAFGQHLLAGQTLLQAVLPGMRAAGYGRLVNIISTSVKEPIPNLGVSNTVRAAVASWAKTLAGELAADGITVNNVLPGFTETGRLASLIAGRAKAQGIDEDAVARDMLGHVPAARFGKPEEVAAVAAFLCTPAAAYVNGVSIAVDGGRTRSLS
ncbi:SDR family oxidoreductase [Oleiagrimonas soli]|uniref:3-oxoacyl-[acyl-carrier protein] reductase n=1 Tax=Oleiagrimonas soli TaxID=1543381 RepID=A0A099CVR3_9GAMM|nr:SDR family oxidoreductase [Oleiagrimonas soli]KGI77717.1 short-chain dehydrogenase [Oleiagrimonas soli]MBB6182881.1 3-oxoacyl-[acyl-carrier protein] reductase [Oleiagrimonas soli]